MRIAIVTETYAPDLNGVARTLVALVGELRRLGHSVSLVRPTPRGVDLPLEEGEVRVTGMAIPGYTAMQFGFPPEACCVISGTRSAPMWCISTPKALWVIPRLTPRAP